VQSTRRLRRWLYTVDGGRLEAGGCHGWAGTLTVRDMPPTADHWKATRQRFLKRALRAGMVRGQWLTEWQRRGAPHIHGALYFDESSGVAADQIIDHWLAAAADWRPAPSGQSVQPIWGLPGWLQYQAKHSARGVRHYQRANVPEAWREGTGRLWGYVGEWPTREQLVEVDGRTFHRYRRLLRGWLRGKAHSRGDAARCTWLRGMLRDPERSRSAARAVGAFVPEDVSRQLLLAAAEGDVELLDEHPGDAART
jgi:hypothetical protein